MSTFDLAGSILEGLGRGLPHRAARRVGRVCGHLARGVLPGRRRRAEEALRQAFPDLEPDRSRWLRGAFAHRGAAMLDTASAGHLEAPALCRRLTLEGWEHLEAAESQGRGILVLGAQLGHWQLAALAVALYRGPIDVAQPCEDSLRRLFARFAERLGCPLLVEHTEAAASRALRDGGRLAVWVDRTCGETPAGNGDPSGPFWRSSPAAAFAAREALATGASAVPVFGFPRPRGAYRVVVREPIAATGDQETLTRLYVEAAEREIRSHPELYPWWRTGTES